MSFSRGVNRQIAIIQELTFGVVPVGTSRELRRVSSTPNMNRDAFRSQEILRSMQIRDARLGAQRPTMTHTSHLAPGSFPEFFEGMLRRKFQTIVATGAELGTVTAAAGPGPGVTITVTVTVTVTVTSA